jgi:HD superfamily phosphohydrolase
VLETVSHPALRRLCQTTQLGFVSLVYPGAVHTRFEHSLGVFEKTCSLLRGLWYDSANCLFRSILRERDLLAGLVSALIHDLGQYPMAHDLTEVSTRFSHEQFTESILFSSSFDSVQSLADMLRSAWGITPDEVLAVLRSSEHSSLRERILHSVISGPIDADKLDYLLRDGLHLGVKFGEAIDCSRLFRNVTVCTDWKFDQNRGEIQHVAEIGVMDRALVVADSVWRARRDMFRQVYWQHTVRSLKAMLAFVVRRICLEFDRTDGREDERLKRAEVRGRFWESFRELVMEPSSRRFPVDGSASIATRDRHRVSLDRGEEFFESERPGIGSRGFWGE